MYQQWWGLEDNTNLPAQVGVLVGMLTVMGIDLKVVGHEAALQMPLLCCRTRTPGFKYRCGALECVEIVVGQVAAGGSQRLDNTKLQIQVGTLVGVLTVMDIEFKVVGHKAALQRPLLSWKTPTPSFKHRWGKLAQVFTVVGHVAAGCFAEAVALLDDCRLPHDHPIIHV